MEDPAQNSANSTSSSAFSKGLVLILLVAVLVLGAVLGVVLERYVLGQQGTATETASDFVAKEDLPVPAEILTNPVHYQWWASSEGVLVRKTAASFTLSKDGETVEFPVNEDTVFVDEAQVDPETGALGAIEFGDIAVGSTLRGGSFVVSNLDGTTSLRPQTFTVVLEP